jgi:hypothetical protein
MKSCPMLTILIVSCLGPATAENYTDKLVGFSFVNLPGWTLEPHAPVLGGPGTCVGMKDPDATKYEFITICGKPDITDAVRIDQTLRSGFTNYISWRTGSFAGETQLTVRPGSLLAGMIGGQESLSVILDYTKSNQPGAAYIVWVQSGKTRLSLIGETAASHLDSMIERLKPLRDSIRVP